MVGMNAKTGMGAEGSVLVQPNGLFELQGKHLHRSRRACSMGRACSACVAVCQILLATAPPLLAIICRVNSSRLQRSDGAWVTLRTEQNRVVAASLISKQCHIATQVATSSHSHLHLAACCYCIHPAAPGLSHDMEAHSPLALHIHAVLLVPRGPRPERQHHLADAHGRRQAGTALAAFSAPPADGRCCFILSMHLQKQCIKNNMSRHELQGKLHSSGALPLLSCS